MISSVTEKVVVRFDMSFKFIHFSCVCYLAFFFFRRWWWLGGFYEENFYLENRPLVRNNVNVIRDPTCSSIWFRSCLEFLKFSLEAAVDNLNCFRASSNWDMGRVWAVVAELGNLRDTKHIQLSVSFVARSKPNNAKYFNIFHKNILQNKTIYIPQ